MCLDWERKLEYLEETLKTQENHANSTYNPTLEVRCNKNWASVAPSNILWKTILFCHLFIRDNLCSRVIYFQFKPNSNVSPVIKYTHRLVECALVDVSGSSWLILNREFLLSACNTDQSAACVTYVFFLVFHVLLFIRPCAFVAVLALSPSPALTGLLLIVFSCSVSSVYHCSYFTTL